MDTSDSTGYAAPHAQFSDDTSRQRTTSSQPERDQHKPQNNGPKKHYGLRKCRICYDLVRPTLRERMEGVPGFLQPGPEVVYEDELGRLIRPCKCKGSTKYVHEVCLSTWRTKDPSNKKNFYQCTTCGFKYQLSRLGWADLLKMKVTPIALTITIFLVTAFVLGFVADPIIRFALDPMAAVAEQFVEGSEDLFPESDDPVSWYEHFLNGFASIGLVSFMKVFLSNPLNWLSRWSPGGLRGRGTSGRDRISNYTWVFILFGIAMFLAGIWQVVQKWSVHILKQVEQKVMDVHDEDDEDDEEFEEEDEEAPQAAS